MLSFVVPAFNEELELPGSLAAIRKAAETAGHQFEIVVVNDSSTDGTLAIALASGARVLVVHYRHIAAARNAGARTARGEILFFVDADTHIGPEHITGAIRALEAGYLGGSARVCMDGEVPPWARILFNLFCTVYFAAQLGIGAFLFTRRKTYEAVGGFDEQYFAGEEKYFSIALKNLGPFKILREPVTTSGRKVRLHSARSILTQVLSIIFGGRKGLCRREKLGLWYDGKREGRVA